MESKQDSANPSEASSQAVASLEGIQRRDKAAILEGLSGESALTKAAKEGNLDKVRYNFMTDVILARYAPEASCLTSSTTLCTHVRDLVLTPPPPLSHHRFSICTFALVTLTNVAMPSTLLGASDS